MSETKYFRVPIPKGYRIYFPDMEVAGLGYRKVEFSSLLNSGQVGFELEPDPRNEHDANAVKIVGIKQGFFREKRVHIGFVPREVAQAIAESGCLAALQVRPKSMWIGDRGGIGFVVDLLGLKSDHPKYFET